MIVFFSIPNAFLANNMHIINYKKYYISHIEILQVLLMFNKQYIFDKKIVS